MKLRDIAGLIGGELRGEGDVEISGVSGLDDAREGDISYIASPKWVNAALQSRASAFLCAVPIAKLDEPQVITKNPQLSFARLLSRFYVRPHPVLGISERAFVSRSAKIRAEVTIYPFAYVDEDTEIGAGTVLFPGVFVGRGTVIGERCLIYPHVTIREGISIGDRVIVHAGAVIGADGFGYVFDEGVHHKIPQVGTVRIEDDVEIGAATTIDRATTGVTIIGRGTKVDNLVQIGHNVQVGRSSIIVAQVGIAGSSRIGDGVILGGQAGVADHTTIESGTMIGAKSGALGEMKRGIYSGTTPMPHREWLKAQAVFAKLPDLKKRIEALEETLRAFTVRADTGKGDSSDEPCKEGEEA
ncbi:MAG: UDP-3-O-(3-hydroxymyristoyl)glucosamine N-acyltransferase [Chloroflexota bacterium]